MFPNNLLNAFALIGSKLGKPHGKDAAFDPGNGGVCQTQGSLPVFQMQSEGEIAA